MTLLNILLDSLEELMLRLKYERFDKIHHYNDAGWDAEITKLINVSHKQYEVQTHLIKDAHKMVK